MFRRRERGRESGRWGGGGCALGHRSHTAYHLTYRLFFLGLIAGSACGTVVCFSFIDVRHITQHARLRHTHAFPSTPTTSSPFPRFREATARSGRRERGGPPRSAAHRYTNTHHHTFQAAPRAPHRGQPQLSRGGRTEGEENALAPIAGRLPERCGLCRLSTECVQLSLQFEKEPAGNTTLFAREVSEFEGVRVYSACLLGVQDVFACPKQASIDLQRVR